MQVEDAVLFVDKEIKKIETKAGAEAVLQPWAPDAHTTASAHWGLVQQRIALSRKHPQGRLCCSGLNLDAAERSEAQRAATAASGERLRASRAA
jgi:hypothetical protein